MKIKLRDDEVEVCGSSDDIAKKDEAKAKPISANPEPVKDEDVIFTDDEVAALKALLAKKDDILKLLEVEKTEHAADDGEDVEDKPDEEVECEECAEATTDEDEDKDDKEDEKVIDTAKSHDSIKKSASAIAPASKQKDSNVNTSSAWQKAYDDIRKHN